MKKRLLSVILTGSMLLPVCANAVSNEDAPIPEWIVEETTQSAGMSDPSYAHIYDLLKYMGCVERAAEEMEPDEEITRAEAVSVLAKINGAVSKSKKELFSDVKITDEYADGIYSALDANLIENTTGKFYPKKSMTLNDSISVALRVLGYGIIPNLDEISYAKDLKLTQNVQTENGVLTRGNFYKFVENVLAAKPAGIEIGIPNESYKIDVIDNSYLSEYKNISYITGIVTATQYSAIYNKKNFVEGRIEINNAEMEALNYISEDMLGKQVVAYVDTEDDKNLVVAVAENKKYNESILIDNSDFNGFYKSYISYNNENSSKKVKISDNAVVVYNGQFGGDISKAEEYLKDFDTVRTLDNNRDGEADILFIEKLQYAYIESASEASQSLRTNMGEYIDLSEEVCKSYRIYNENGELITLSQIVPGTVIEYRAAYSYDKLYVYEILTSTSKVVGVYSGKRVENSKTYYKIDGDEYELTDYYEEYLKKDVKDKKPQIGSEASFYLSTNGKVVYSTANVYSYGYIIKGHCDEDNEKYVLTIYNYDGVRDTYTLKDKVKFITPDNTSGSRQEAEEVFAKLKGSDGSIENKVIAYQASSDNTIKLIATEMDMTGQAPGTIDYPLVKNKVIAAGTGDSGERRIYQELIGYTWYVPSSVKRMTVPADKSKLNDEKYFSVGQTKGQGGTNNEYLLYEHILYNSDEFYNVGFCITKENKVGLSSDILEPCVITKVSASINDEDEEGIEIEYIQKKEKKQVFINYDTIVVPPTTAQQSFLPTGTIQGLQSGDVVSFEKDSVGDVSILKIIFKIDALPARGAYGTDGITEDSYFTSFSSMGILHGVVEKTQATTESAVINISADGNDPKGSKIFRIGKHGVGFYDYNIILKEGKNFSVATFNDLMPGDEVIGIKRYNRVTDLYILR